MYQNIVFCKSKHAICACFSSSFQSFSASHTAHTHKMDGGGTFWIFKSVIDHYCHDEMEKHVNCYVEKISNNQPNAIESPIIVKISIDYEKWSMVSEWKLALHTLLNEPLQSQMDIEMCVWLKIYSSLIERYPQLKLPPQLNQIHCIIRFSNLPMSMEYQFVPYRHPVRLSLSIMKCVLYSFGDCSALLRQTIWYCPKQCPNSKNLIINAEHSDVNNDKWIKKCSLCNENLHEYEVNCECWLHRF